SVPGSSTLSRPAMPGPVTVALGGALPSLPPPPCGLTLTTSGVSSMTPVCTVTSGATTGVGVSPRLQPANTNTPINKSPAVTLRTISPILCLCIFETCQHRIERQRVDDIGRSHPAAPRCADAELGDLHAEDVVGVAVDGNLAAQFERP